VGSYTFLMKTEEVDIDNMQDSERKDWAQFSVSQLGRAYGESEPDYSDSVVKEPNPEYTNEHIKLKAGDIALAVIPQDDQQKIRPVLILKTLPKFNDLLVCGISSQIHRLIPDFDLLLKDTHLAFAESGLKGTSIFRLGSLAVLQPSKIIVAIGTLRSDLHNQLLKNLSAYLLK
jgi:mRNA interferase MazF